MVNTLITKFNTWFDDWLDRKLNHVDPWIQQQAKERLDEYKKLLRTGGGHCPYSGQFIPPKEGN